MTGKTLSKLACAATVAASMLSGAAAAQDKTTVDQMVKGANEEGKLVVLLLQPKDGDHRRQVIDAFKKRFNLDIDVEWSPMHPTTLMSRLNAESPSGTFSGDVGQGSIDDLWPSVKNGFVAKIDWQGTFGTELPGIANSIAGVPSEMDGTVLSMFDLVYGLIWNPDFIDEAELPRKVADLTDKQWESRLALNSYHIAPVDYLNYVIGGPETVEIVRKLLDNRPILKAGSGAVGAAVSTGEAVVGTGMAYATDLAIDRGEPIRFRPFTDYTPVLGMKVFVPEYAPHPNAARLFAAWFSTEGMALIGEKEHLGQLGNPDSKVGADLAKQISEAGSEIVSVSSVDQFTNLASTRKIIDQMIAGQ